MGPFTVRDDSVVAFRSQDSEQGVVRAQNAERVSQSNIAKRMKYRRCPAQLARQSTVEAKSKFRVELRDAIPIPSQRDQKRLHASEQIPSGNVQNAHRHQAHGSVEVEQLLTDSKNMRCRPELYSRLGVRREGHPLWRLARSGLPPTDTRSKC